MQISEPAFPAILHRSCWRGIRGELHAAATSKTPTLFRRPFDSPRLSPG
jgi:hypothetical protein